MEQAGVVYYWVRFGLVVLAALLAVFAALRRSRAAAARRDIVFAAATVIAVAVPIALGVRPQWTMLAALFAAGAAVGFAAAAIRPLIAWLTVPIVAFSSVMLLFGGPLAIAFGVSVLALASGLAVGQAVRRPKQPALSEAVEPPARAAG